MLDGTVRFGKGWVDQVTQFSSCGNFCHGDTVRARAYVRAWVCVALCACFERTCTVASVCFLCIFNISLSTHTSIYTCDVTFINSTRGSDTSRTNAHIFNSIQIHIYPSLCIDTYIHLFFAPAMYACMYVSMRICVSACVSACACLSESVRLSMHVCTSILGERKGHNL